jgi:hypothetical protein
MTAKLRLHFYVCFATTLSACGGGDDNANDVDAVIEYSSFVGIQTDAAELTDQYISTNGTLAIAPSLESDLPVTGSAEFNGFVVASISGSEMIGQLSIEANFATASVNGTAWNFIHEVNGAYTGTLSADGILTPGATSAIPQISATLEGTLQNNSQFLPTTIALEGDFLGTEFLAIGGNADGFIGGEFASGIFAAEQ